MNREDQLNFLEGYINDTTGIKATELAARPEIYSTLRNFDVYHGLVEQLVQEGRIIEIEYVLLGTNRIKSFYLPKGTEVRVVD